MTTPRAALAARLTAALPESVRVIEHARNIDTPTRPTVMVKVNTVVPHPEAPTTHRLYRFELVLLAARIDPMGAADEEVDTLLQITLDAIDGDDTMTWTTANRAVWLDTTTPAYEVAVEVTHQKVSTP